VRNVIWVLVFLKSFVISLVIGLYYVKLIHCLWLQGVLLCECGKDNFRITCILSFENTECGNPLVLAMCRIVLHFLCLF